MNHLDKSTEIQSCCKEILELYKTTQTSQTIRRKVLRDKTAEEIVKRYGLDIDYIFKILSLKR